ncbi:MAG: hypothetical protein LBH62_09735 [Nitrososphaerota archaeon]|nr:hypothetical protein [Nitrososphaerota archaeon]
MSELVSTLWFEDVGFLHEQMLDTPLGRFSIRQMILFLVFGLLSWLCSLVFADLVLKIVVAGGIFFGGAALFTRKIKTVSPEAHLLCLIRRFTVQIKQKHSATKAKQSMVVHESKAMLLSATIGVPVKIVGVLKDLTGKVLQDKNFKVNLNNTLHSSGITDQEGSFCTYFIPDRSGVFQIAIQPEDSTDPLQQITVHVQPKTKNEEDKEGKENAEKTTKSKI